MVMDSTVGTEAAKRATSTIPIVMALVLDPVGSGLIKSLAHPCGNVTGLSMMTTVDLNSKRLELLKGMIPQLSNVAVVWNPDHPVHGRAVEGLKTRAPSWRSSLLLCPCARRTNLSQRYRISKEERSKRCMLSRTRCFFAQRETLLKFAAAARLPTLHDVRRWPEEGALISYGPDFYDLFRRSAGYVARILKGTKPAELPVEQPTRFELVINLKTAKALGVAIPPNLLAPADDVIE